MKLKYVNLIHQELLEHLDEDSFEVWNCSDKPFGMHKYDELHPLINPKHTYTTFMKELEHEQYDVFVDKFFNIPGSMLTYYLEDTRIYINSDLTYEEAAAIVLSRKEAELLEGIVKQCLNTSSKRGTL